MFEATIASGTQAALATVLFSILKTLAISVPLALAAAGLFVLLLRRHWLPDHLQVPAMLGTVLVVHVVSNMVQHEAGLATVTLLGMLLANQRFARLEHVAEFKEHLTVLLISTLFILLASRLDPWDVVALGWGGVGFLLLLLFVVRPASIFGSLLGSGMNLREQAFLAWLAPRGIVAVAVSSVFALHAAHHFEEGHLAEHTFEEMQSLVSLTFLVVVGTVGVYGLTSGLVARRLGVAEPDPQGMLFLGANRVSIAIAEALHAADVAVLLVDVNRHHVREARMKGLRVAQGNALSESFQERLDLGGLGRMLATTPNDEVNTLATLEYADLFGRSGVYQLAGEPSKSEHEETAGRHRGRTLFASHLDYDTLDARLAAGATIKRTPLTEEFDLDQFREMYGETAEILFVRQSTGTILVNTMANGIVPKAGQTVFALVDVDPDEPPRPSPEHLTNVCDMPEEPAPNTYYIEVTGAGLPEVDGLFVPSTAPPTESESGTVSTPGYWNGKRAWDRADGRSARSPAISYSNSYRSWRICRLDGHLAYDLVCEDELPPTDREWHVYKKGVAPAPRVVLHHHDPREPCPEPNVVFVIGGPGSGKGTMCELAELQLGWTHLSTGELLREEMQSGGPSAAMIEELLAGGNMAPTEIVVALLRDAMETVTRTTGRNNFLLDGFPARSRTSTRGWRRSGRRSCRRCCTSSAPSRSSSSGSWAGRSTPAVATTTWRA